MDEENRNAAICVTDDSDFVTKETDGSLGTEKAKIKKIIVVVLALLFVFQIIYEVSGFIPGFEKKYFINSFSDHRELMEKWADKMTEMFDSEKTVHDDLEYISLIPYLPSYNNGVFNFSCFLADGTKYNIAVPAADDDYNDLMNIQRDIPNPEENSGEYGLAIFVTDKQVSFRKFRYAVVYSRSGWKPGYIRPTDNYETYRVTRIDFHWYHVVGFDSGWLFFAA